MGGAFLPKYVRSLSLRRRQKLTGSKYLKHCQRHYGPRRRLLDPNQWFEKSSNLSSRLVISFVTKNTLHNHIVEIVDLRNLGQTSVWFGRGQEKNMRTLTNSCNNLEKSWSNFSSVWFGKAQEMNLTNLTSQVSTWRNPCNNLEKTLTWFQQGRKIVSCLRSQLLTWVDYDRTWVR